MKFISVKGHFQSDCLDPERIFIINTSEIIAIYQSTARYVINLKTPIEEMDLDKKSHKIFVIGDIEEVFNILEIINL